jgi:predicted RNA-binding Zn-ribbon protein involved in translation (DUF1610 family)
MIAPRTYSIPVIIIVVILAALFLLMNDTGKSQAITQICPKCGKRTLRKLKKDDKRFGTSKWLCAHCGNDEDEFGNKF